jgi:hypothetical protein
MLGQYNKNKYRSFPLVDYKQFWLCKLPAVLPMGIANYVFKESDRVMELPDGLFLHADWRVDEATDGAGVTTGLGPHFPFLNKLTASADYNYLTLHMTNSNTSKTAITEITVPRTIAEAPITVDTVSHYGRIVLGADGVSEILDVAEQIGEQTLYVAPDISFDNSGDEGYRETMFDPTTLINMAYTGVRAIEGDTGLPIDGTVYLEEGYNTRILLDPGTNTISIIGSAGAGLGVSMREPRREFLPCDAILRKLNSVETDSSGNLDIVGDGGIKVEVQGGKIVISVDPVNRSSMKEAEDA